MRFSRSPADVLVWLERSKTRLNVFSPLLCRHLEPLFKECWTVESLCHCSSSKHQLRRKRENQKPHQVKHPSKQHEQSISFLSFDHRDIRKSERVCFLILFSRRLSLFRFFRPRDWIFCVPVLIWEWDKATERRKMYSEEITKLNKALSCCAKLRTELKDAIGHIHRLSDKYSQVDYMEGIRVLENSYSMLSPHAKRRAPSSAKATSTPKTSMPTTSTPKVSARVRVALQFPAASKKSTPSGKRAPQETKRNNNKIAVRMIKVQRNIESIIAKLKAVQKVQQRNHAIALEQSLYQSCNNSACDSPGKLGHSQCFADHFSDSFGGHNHNNSSCHIGRRHRTPSKDGAYLAPLHQIHKRAIAINVRLSLLKSC